MRLNWNANAAAPLELYDLLNDPGEEKNISARHPEIVRVMEARMARSHTDHAGKTPPPTWGSGRAVPLAPSRPQ